MSWGVMYQDGKGVRQDYFEAFLCYKLAASKGLDKAQHNLELMYRDGMGVPQDLKEAERYFTLAADPRIHRGIRYKID